MDILTYGWKAALAWFVGFFPLAEIYVAVPAAFATGLDPFSAVFWSVLGNYTPVLLIHCGYDQLMRIVWVQRWITGLVSDKLQASIARYGFWFVLIITPWAGVWVTVATAKFLRMPSAILLIATLLSIGITAIIIAVLLSLGIDIVTE